MPDESYVSGGQDVPDLCGDGGEHLFRGRPLGDQRRDPVQGRLLERQPL